MFLLFALQLKRPASEAMKFDKKLPAGDLSLPSTASSGTMFPLQHMGPGGNAIAIAASQAIAATTQLTGRRTSSLKASLEAISDGVHAHEFSIGLELAGAAQAAIASTSFGPSSSSAFSMLDDGQPQAKKKKKSAKANEQVLDVVNAGASSLLGDAGPTDDLMIEGIEPEWNMDPNEPRYCICNNVSYGDMVACDNEDVSPYLSK